MMTQAPGLGVDLDYRLGETRDTARIAYSKRPKQTL